MHSIHGLACICRQDTIKHVQPKTHTFSAVEGQIVNSTDLTETDVMMTTLIKFGFPFHLSDVKLP